MNSAVSGGSLACNRMASIAILAILRDILPIYYIGNQFDRDYFRCVALPVPSEDDYPEDGYKVDKVRAGRQHWD